MIRCPECGGEMNPKKTVDRQHKPGCAMLEAFKQLAVAKIDLHKINPKTFVTYANNATQCFCQVRLESGERILVSGAQGAIKVFRMRLFGMIPSGCLATLDAHRLSTLFPFEMCYGLLQPEQMAHPLDLLSIVLSGIENVGEIEKFFLWPLQNQAECVKHVLEGLKSEK
jgi:hypothetical protein